MRGTQLCKWFLVPAVLTITIFTAVQGFAMERNHSWASDPRSLATSTQGLEEFLPKGDSPRPDTGFGSVLGGWTWPEIGIPGEYGGAGISIDYPYLYLCHQKNDSTYVVDVSSGAPESVVAVFQSPGNHLSWGAGMDGRPLFWLGDIDPSNHSWVYEMSVFPPAPTPTGESLNTMGPSIWMADIADNFPGDTIFQLGVGQMDSAQNNRIYAFHVPSGTVGRIFGDTTWTYISQRGLTYNRDCGTFFVGGWNSRIVWEIDYANGTPIPGRSLNGDVVAGLAYQDSACDGTAKLWIQTNGMIDELYLVCIGPCEAVRVEEVDKASGPEVYGLDQNCPNPFSCATAILYSIPKATKIIVQVHDVAGRLVETLVNETQQPGVHEVHWNRGSNPSGVYFYSLRACPESSPEPGEGRSRRAEEFVETRKMVVVE